MKQQAELDDTNNQKKLLIVGYANSGKSTLVRKLTHCEEKCLRRNTMTELLFSSKVNHYVIPSLYGHKDFLKNVLFLAGTLKQYDAVVLVVDCDTLKYNDVKRKKEIEGQMILINSLFSGQLILCLNKFDQSIVKYSQSVYNRCMKQLSIIIRKLGFRNIIQYIPISALNNENITSRSINMSWYTGYTLIEALDTISTYQTPLRIKPLRLIVQEMYKINRENVIVGHVAYGVLRSGMQISVVPSGNITTVDTIERENVVQQVAVPGDYIGFTTKPELSIKRGSVYCNPQFFPADSSWNSFTALIYRNNESIDLMVGSHVSIHCHYSFIRCEIVEIIYKLNRRSGAIVAEHPSHIPSNSIVLVRLVTSRPIVYETFAEFPELGKISVSGNGRSIGYGVIQQIQYAPPSVNTKLPNLLCKAFTDVVIVNSYY
jgi:translation elongation factor EF-1alpha